jgi:hypothetical protein
MEYSSFLLRQKDKPPGDGEEGGDMVNTSTVEYKQAIVNAISKSRGHQQKGVLSFKSTTPSASSELCSQYLEGYISFYT